MCEVLDTGARYRSSPASKPGLPSVFLSLGGPGYSDVDGLEEAIPTVRSIFPDNLIWVVDFPATGALFSFDCDSAVREAIASQDQPASGDAKRCVDEYVASAPSGLLQSFTSALEYQGESAGVLLMGFSAGAMPVLHIAASATSADIVGAIVDAPAVSGLYSLNDEIDYQMRTVLDSTNVLFATCSKLEVCPLVTDRYESSAQTFLQAGGDSYARVNAMRFASLSIGASIQFIEAIEGLEAHGGTESDVDRRLAEFTESGWSQLAMTAWVGQQCALGYSPSESDSGNALISLAVPFGLCNGTRDVGEPDWLSEAAKIEGRMPVLLFINQRDPLVDSMLWKTLSFTVVSSNHFGHGSLFVDTCAADVLRAFVASHSATMEVDVVCPEVDLWKAWNTAPVDPAPVSTTS